MVNNTDFPWLKNYPSLVPKTINPDFYPNLLALIDESFQSHGSCSAFKCLGISLTFKQVDDYSKRIAVHFKKIGLKKGDRVGVMLPNVMQNPISIIAILRAGLVVVNINPLYSSRELKHQLVDSGATAIVILENFLPTLAVVLKEVNVKNIVVTRVGDLLGVKGFGINLALKFLKRVQSYKKFSSPNISLQSLKKVLLSNQYSVYETPQLKSCDIAFLQYTGGTTGVAKGAILTHKNIIANCLQVEAWLMPAFYAENDSLFKKENSSEQEKDGRGVIVCALPLYHIFALTGCMFLGMRVNMTNLLVPNPRDFAGFVKLLSREKFDIFPGVNTLFQALINQPDFDKISFSNLKITLSGAMPLNRSLAEQWQKQTGCPIIEGYGLSETSPAVAVVPVNAKSFQDNVGLPISSTQVAIIDDNETVQNYNQIGQIVIKGPQVMTGYWKNSVETKNAFTKSGFFKSGDLGFINENGFVKIVDRIKDLIIVSGFNVYPNEVEEVVCRHPNVKECAVVGIPNEQSGEIVKLFVVSGSDKLTRQEIFTLCKKNLAAYKCPKVIVFVSNLPKSNVGKILKRELRSSI
ncbi:MAG: hypothetical protein CBC42_00765 [Betaproteobacteria bacterium TMED82]|nr:MAG: hypothetical protein CBC42_00765 [Betaproteobacteria bacterium TMED82]|tara:strand:+ start:21384 stop:23117 length:1734 start_codon:yes stop_codon:yes gene_type:complete